ncbi:hypothetical protein Hanom_Chr12g01101461 [Helianthus anomalus]
MNIACYLSDPPKGFEMYKSMIVGLNTCRLAHSLRENPVIREDWIKDFWDNATTKKGDKVMKSKVQGTEVSISEQDVHEVLVFDEAADEPKEYSKGKVMEVLVKMSYEGASPPPTIKKLLHPYWRFLAHIYLVCISGNKSGLDKLTLKQPSVVVSVVEGWKYNYLNSVFDDMLVNVKTLNVKYWYKFPRFVQMILEKKYPKLPITVKTYDVKMMNHLINAMVAEEHDVEIIEAPVGVQESMENMDLTSIESEEDIADDRMVDDEEGDESVDESETETETLDEGLTEETEDVNETVHMSPPHVEHVSTTETVVDHSQ